MRGSPRDPESLPVVSADPLPAQHRRWDSPLVLQPSDLHAPRHLASAVRPVAGVVSPRVFFKMLHRRLLPQPRDGSLLFAAR